MDKPLVRVKWQDAYSGAANRAFEESEIPHEILDVETIGWLLKDDEKGVSLACEYLSDKTWRGHTMVPRPMVISVEPLVAPPRKRPRSKASAAVPTPAEGGASAS